MSAKTALSNITPSWVLQIGKKREDSRELVDCTIFSTRNILDGYEEIDFNTVSLEEFIHFLKNDKTLINDFFKKEERIEQVLFPFFDFLKNTYFSKNTSIPENIKDILMNHPSLQNGIISYIEQRNSHILTSQHVEQYDTIAFHLFLLWMDQDFDLVKDIQSDYFTKISGLFVDSTARVSQSLGVMKVWVRENPSETLILELRRCIQLGETINKLALIHSANFEERQISFDLGVIIRNNIDSLLRQLDSNFVENHIIGKMLRNFSGKVQGNFAHGVIMNGSVIQINQQASHIKKEQQEGFSRQEAADFWQDDKNGELYKKEREISEIVFLWNRALTELIRIEQIEKLHWSISPELHEEKLKSLNEIIYIYSYAVGRELKTTEEIFMDIEHSGIKNEFQIEALYYILLYGVDINETSLEKLIIFFLSNKKQLNNFFYEQSDIKIITQTIKKLHVSKERLRFLPLIERIHASLSEKDISHSALSYSKIYLSLALYYIECEGEKYMEYAQRCFSRYKDLSAGLVDVERNTGKIQDEKHFYATLWRADEMMRHWISVHNKEWLRKAWIFALAWSVERYQLMAILSIEAEVGKIIASMNNSWDNIFSQNQINNLFGKKIAETIFYNLCTITVVGDCQNCEKNQDTIECTSYRNSPQKQEGKCSLVPFKRGFQEKSISLAWGISIIFTYPSVSEKIFEKIFSEQYKLIKERFSNLITIHHKNTLLQESQIELDRLAFYDGETGLPNENKLIRDILWREKTIILIDIAGYNDMVATQGGKDNWREIMKKVALYLQTKTKATVYSYDKTTFCLVYEPSKFSDMALLLGEDIKDTVSNFIEVLLANFHIEYGKNVQFHAGIVMWQKEEHIKYAHTALIKAKQSREKHLYIFQAGDERVPEEIRHYTNMLVMALDSNNTSTKFVPYYQYIHDPKNPHARRAEALVRIEHVWEDGEKKVIEPGKFMEIAENKRCLSGLTMSMLHQIISDMKEDTSLNVSINIHEQDWNDDWIIRKLRALSTEPNSIVDRISLEVLEMVPFNRPEDREKIRELKSLGYKISLDDYGESEGNIKKVIRVKPNNIKIDQSVILSLYEDEYREEAIIAIETVVYHAKRLGATVTAERIESKEVFDFLYSLGIDFFQWYYFAKPVPFNKVQIWDYKGER